MYSDASFNVSNGYSQGRYIMYLIDQHNNSCPISWKSTKLQQVTKSIFAPEIPTFTKGADAACFISQLGNESKLASPSSQINTHTDNKSLYDSESTTSKLQAKKLGVEMFGIREMKDKGEIIVCWIGKENQIADSLTKKGPHAPI